MLTIDKTRALFPVSSQRIALDLFTEADITPRYIAWLNDPEVVKYSNQRFKRHTHESCQTYLQALGGSESLFLSLTTRDNKTPIGTLSAHLNTRHHSADIGILLGDKSYWGQGLGGEAWSLLMAVLLEQAGVRKVSGGTLSCNQAMIAIMEGAGMQADGTRIAQELVEGKAYNIVHYARFRQ